VVKSGVLEHESGNISERRKDRGKVTMESLQEVTNVLSNGTIPEPLRPPLPQDWGFTTHPKTAITIISRTANTTQAHVNFGENGAWAYLGTA